MIEFNRLTIIIPSLLSNIKESWIDQVNRFNKEKINIIISAPPDLSKANKFIYKFDKDILIIRSDKKGQVNQRQYGYKFARTEYLMNMDDDIFISIKNLRILLNQFQNLPYKSSLVPRLISNKNYNKKLFLRKFINFLIYNQFSPQPGTITKSTFEVAHNFSLQKDKEIENVDWIPGGISIIRKENIIKNDYFKFEGKAYCEDLINSYLLKNNGIQLFISNKSFYKTETQNYKDLTIPNFINFLKNDFKARNYYRVKIKNSLTPFLIAYFFLILNYFLNKIIINFFVLIKEILDNHSRSYNKKI